MDLSVVIPARHELFLKQTIEDVLAHRRADTEVIVVCDGEWPLEPLAQHPRVQVVHVAQAIGQRAATNLGIRLSTAPYIMKLDAHCSVAEGFDVELIKAAQELGPLATQVPTQWNLHAFDWVCDHCGDRRDQGPTPTTCCNPVCAADLTRLPLFHRDIVWERRRGNNWYRFDSGLVFGYFGALGHREESKVELTDTMSLLGACWFMSRERFWQLDGLDEAHGGWGQMGTEIACKTWLSGGRLVSNRRTWYAHMFRTQGKDFGFPYEIHESDKEYAREYSRKLWFNNAWPKQVRTLKSLVQQFAPIPGWDQDQIEALSDTLTRSPATKGLVYYSDCQGEKEILNAARQQIVNAAPRLARIAVTLKELPIIFSQTPRGFYGNPEASPDIVLDLPRGYLTMFKQILAGLESLDTDIAFLVEHDVLYHPSHFEFTPVRNDVFYYNQHVYKVDAVTGRALHYRCSQTSGLCANRQLLVNHYRKRVALVEANGFSRKMGFEPGTHGRPERVDDFKAETWMSKYPNVDIRHNHNLTPTRWSKNEFRNQKFTEGWTEVESIPGWGHTAGRFSDFLMETVCAVA